MFISTPIGLEALQARDDDLRRAADRSRFAAGDREPTARRPARRRRGRRTLVRWLRLA